MVGQRKRRVNSTCEETVPGHFGFGHANVYEV